ncbi:MAG: hypothetical protein ACTHK8_01465, partial [Ginsengibacter sp.]
YLGKVFDDLLQGCTEIIDQLIAVTTDGMVEMKDNERIQNIDMLFDQMQDRWLFVQDFANANSKMMLQRMEDQNDINVGGNLFDK